MHETAYELGEKFFKIYCKDTDTILDIGSFNMNGTLRDFCPKNAKYTGVDLCSGKGVDIVIESSEKLPFESNTFDIVVSSSCLEHDTFFWLTFLEMVRVLKPNGYCYINAPSHDNYNYHYHPYDCWRFYPDAGIALKKWAEKNSIELTLIESFINPPKQSGWSDFVMVFKKCKTEYEKKLIVDDIKDAKGIRKLK